VRFLLTAGARCVVPYNYSATAKLHIWPPSGQCETLWRLLLIGPRLRKSLLRSPSLLRQHRATREAGGFPHKDRVSLVDGGDLTDEASVARLYEGVTDLWASIHIAGGFAMPKMCEANKAKLMQMLNMNFVTCYLCCRSAVQSFGSAGGRIVNVAARPALEPRAGAGMVAYTASKAAGRRSYPGARGGNGGTENLGQRCGPVDHRIAGVRHRSAVGRRIAPHAV
jgi:NAD(P)-dependent dehydrogenase (short-subunit alcohol dehydrogenase family)